MGFTPAMVSVSRCPWLSLSSIALSNATENHLIRKPLDLFPGRNYSRIKMSKVPVFAADHYLSVFSGRPVSVGF